MNLTYQKITPDSKIKTVYNTPVGRDVIDKVLMQMNVSVKWLNNPLIGNLKIKHLQKWIKDPDFLQVFCDLINQEKDVAIQKGGTLTEQWWKEIVFYQIYPRSFKDGDGDGLGDLQGIISKLDYIAEMGFGGIWLSPIFKSPMQDNGYDISDYYQINPEMGTMQDLKDLISGCHARGLRIILDLVVNHTSAQHPWFVEALNNPSSARRDYYFFRKPDDINNWVSFFFEDAWKVFEVQDIAALHLFADQQFDLNWDNPAVRAEVVKIINFYAGLGIDGYRLDVINYISKKPGLPDGNKWVGDLMEFRGIENYFYGENLHQYLKEINQKAFKPNQLFSIGETPGIGIQIGKLLSADYRQELDLIFNFDHLETPGKVRYDDYQYDLNFYKEYIMKWNNALSNHDWMSLFFENHDNPRMISKVNPNPDYHQVLGKLIAMLLLTLKGTPFIYQGQEAGFINQTFSAEELRDVESLNKLKQSNLATVLAGSRDHARTVIKWTEQGGFSDGKSWIKGQVDSVNSIEQQLTDADSILIFYQKLIKFRNQNVDFIYAPIEFIYPKRKNFFGYIRNDYYIEINLSSDLIKRPDQKRDSQLLISNYHDISAGKIDPKQKMQPYEANLYLLN
ncbi:MAG: alpha-amylase family glycosyl hydrolase [Saccharofermentanales bacterium]|jgi:oligo-1,6-glucosidase